MLTVADILARASRPTEAIVTFNEAVVMDDPSQMNDALHLPNYSIADSDNNPIKIYQVLPYGSRAVRLVTDPLSIFTDPAKFYNLSAFNVEATNGDSLGVGRILPEGPLRVRALGVLVKSSIYVEDTFGGGNTADVTGRMSEVGAKVWTSGAGRPIGIVSHEMNFPADGSGIGVAYVDTGHSDYRASFIGGSVSSPQGPDLAVRIPDPTGGAFHCLLVRFYDGGVIQIYDVTWTANFAAATAGVLLFNSSNTTMVNLGALCEVVCVGSNIEVFKNGVSWGSITSSLNQTATRAGMNIGLGNHCTISDYKVMTP